MLELTRWRIQVLDKSEGNALMVNGHAAWGSIYTISDQSVRPLNLVTNSFCAGGGWLGNGTLASVGGNPTYVSRGRFRLVFSYAR